MLVATYCSNLDIQLEKRPCPQLGEDESLLKIHASDLMEWYHRDKVPLVLGHEVAGEIVEIGNAVTNVSVGYRIVASSRALNADIARETMKQCAVPLNQQISIPEVFHNM